MRARPGGEAGNRAFWALLASCAALRTVRVYFACCIAAALAWQAGNQHFGALLSWPAWAGVALLLLSVVGTVRAGLRLGHGIRATHKVNREVLQRRTEPPPSMHQIDHSGRVVLIRSSAPFAFTYGLLRPRVAVSTGLRDLLAPREMEAVLLHEREHAHNHDPLKSLLTEVLTARYAEMPLLRHLRSAFLSHRELTADRCAAGRCGTASVAGALLKTADAPPWAQAAPAAAMGGSGLLEARVTQLEAGDPPRLGRPSKRRATAIFAGIAGYVWMIAGSALLIAATPVGCMPLPS